MAPISYKKAKEHGLLKENEVKRMASMAMISYSTLKLNNNLCAYEAGTTQGSWGVVFRGAIKKLLDENCGFTEAELRGTGFKVALNPTKCFASKHCGEKVLQRFAIVYLIHNAEIKTHKVS
jgi:hypothetical protein